MMDSCTWIRRFIFGFSYLGKIIRNEVSEVTEVAEVPDELRKESIGHGAGSMEQGEKGIAYGYQRRKIHSGHAVILNRFAQRTVHEGSLP